MATIRHPDKWEFQQDEHGYIKRALCNGNEVMANEIQIIYRPETKSATMRIVAVDFVVTKYSPGESVTGEGK